MNPARRGGSRSREAGAWVSLSSIEVDIRTRSANSETVCGGVIPVGKRSFESGPLQRKIRGRV